MFYTEITETTCKTVRFSGIYGLYVNNSVEKTVLGGFGYWRPRVRVPPLRPKKHRWPLRLSVFFRCGEDENSPFAPRVQNRVRILRAERVELAHKRQA